MSLNNDICAELGQAFIVCVIIIEIINERILFI